MAQFRLWIDSTVGWTFSGLKLELKDQVLVTAEGKWTANPATGEVDADGNQGLSTNNKEGYSYRGPDGREGQLIARVGIGPAFVCGKEKKIAGDLIGQGGDLYFVINDDLTSQYGAGLADNLGGLRVNLVVNP